MTWDQIALLAVLTIFLVLLIRASVVLGKQDPYQRIEEVERLTGGKLPQDMTFEEKQRMLDWFGISRRSAKQSFAYIGIVLLGGLLIYLLKLWASAP